MSAPLRATAANTCPRRSCARSSSERAAIERRRPRAELTAALATCRRALSDAAARRCAGGSRRRSASAATSRFARLGLLILFLCEAFRCAPGAAAAPGSTRAVFVYYKLAASRAGDPGGRSRPTHARRRGGRGRDAAHRPNVAFFSLPNNPNRTLWPRPRSPRSRAGTRPRRGSDEATGSAARPRARCRARDARRDAHVSKLGFAGCGSARSWHPPRSRRSRRGAPRTTSRANRRRRAAPLSRADWIGRRPPRRRRAGPSRTRSPRCPGTVFPIGDCSCRILGRRRAHASCRLLQTARLVRDFARRPLRAARITVGTCAERLLSGAARACSSADPA